MKYVAYVGSALMIIASLGPVYVFVKSLGECDFSRITFSIIFKGAYSQVFGLSFGLPILAIFLSAVLIFWTHKE